MSAKTPIDSDKQGGRDRESHRTGPPRSMRPQLPAGLQSRDAISARAMVVGERIDIRRLAANEWVVSHPALWTVGAEGIAFVFRYGVVVLINCTDSEQARFLHDVRPQVVTPAEPAESESVTLRHAPDHAESVDLDAIWLHDFSPERLQLVAWVLSKSVVLAEYESRVARNFDHIEPFAVELKSRQRGGPSMKKLLEQIGNVLLTEHKMVARVEVTEKPELLWEHSNLEPLYLRLEDEFEITERSAALDRKLALVSRTVNTLVELLQNRRSHRVEWYIVLLIVFEILLTLYEMFLRHR